jgi:hypothetical protein
MFNLLPESLKRELISEYNLRKISIGLVFIFIIQLSSIIFIFPSWIISRTREDGLALQLEKINQINLSSDANAIKERIKSINNEINLLNTALEYPKLALIIDHVLTRKTSETRLNSFSFSVGKNNTLVLKGTSSTRESLVAFADSLRNGGFFKSVDLPVSNLAKSRNIDFSMTLNLN